MDIRFLGCGDAFNYEFGNNAAYFQNQNTMFFLDMGQGIFAKALHLNLLKDIKNAVIFITHCHFDHIGSLGEALTYFSVFHPEIPCTLVYPDMPSLHELLAALYPLEKIHCISDLSGTIFGVAYRAVKAKHEGHAYSYFLKDAAESIYYSGDNSELNEEALSLLKSGTIKRLYQDCSAHGSPFHHGLDQLVNEIPTTLRNQVCLMHLASCDFAKKGSEQGFLAADSLLLR